MGSIEPPCSLGINEKLASGCLGEAQQHRQARFQTQRSCSLVLHRQRGIMKRHGIDLPVSMLCDSVAQGAPSAASSGPALLKQYATPNGSARASLPIRCTLNESAARAASGSKKRRRQRLQT